MASKPTRPSARRTSTRASPPAPEFAFSSRLEQVPGGGPYYIDIPAGVSKAIGRRGIVPVVAAVNDVAEVRASIIPCGNGRHRLRLNAATRDAADATLGKRLSVRLQVDENPMADPLPLDLAGALREVDAFDAFRRMPVGRQNHILRWLDSAVKEATRERRIAQIVEGALAWREDPRDRRWEGAGRG
jgi:Domain of unknown function (DUF1905)/Bacteriocin-protection, YdeI or OmpD-Associated